MAAKKANPFAAMAAKKAVAKKAVAKKANPFAKKMADPMCPPGSMSGDKGTSSGLGAVKKAAKKAAPKKVMGELPNGKVATPRQQRAATPGKMTNRVTGGKGTSGGSGSRQN